MRPGQQDTHTHTNPPTHKHQQQDVVQRLRRAHSGELHLVYDHCRSHAALTRKNALLLTLLEHISVAASKVKNTYPLSFSVSVIYWVYM